MQTLYWLEYQHCSLLDMCIANKYGCPSSWDKIYSTLETVKNSSRLYHLDDFLGRAMIPVTELRRMPSSRQIIPLSGRPGATGTVTAEVRTGSWHIEGILPKGPYLPCVSMAGWVWPFRQDTINSKVVIRWLPFLRWYFQMDFLQWKSLIFKKNFAEMYCKGLINNKSSLVQVMVWCQTDDLTAPSYYLNRCWLIISEVLWHQPEGSFTGNAQDILSLV